MGIPGMGKTTYIKNNLKKFFEETNDCSFVSISNDEIRRAKINEYMQ
jgi:predicted AAA+ superfamily ATPase